VRLLLTGGHGEIGAAIRNRFEQAGWAVVAPPSRELDLAADAGLAPFVAAQAPFEAFVHCAGFNTPRPFEQISLEELERSLRVNTISFVRLCQLLAPGFRARGGARVLAISSIYGVISREKRLAYATSKHALIGAVRSLALELGPDGVLVNALSPGFIDTAMTRRNNDDATILALEAAIPLRRLGRPGDMAELAHFLCSDGNRYLTGQNVVADGGYTAGGFQRG
jgi:NAD(P)-dependent dehydrogenase (short-subunit alcohol dehydrogenase family)